MKNKKQIRAVNNYIEGLLRLPEDDLSASRRVWIKHTLKEYLMVTEGYPVESLFVSPARWSYSQNIDRTLTDFRIKLNHALFYITTVSIKNAEDDQIECSFDSAVDFGKRRVEDNTPCVPDRRTWVDAGPFISNTEGMYWSRFIRKAKGQSQEMWILHTTFNEPVLRLVFDLSTNTVLIAEVLDTHLFYRVYHLLRPFFTLLSYSYKFNESSVKQTNKVLWDCTNEAFRHILEDSKDAVTDEKPMVTHFL
jgi:hypothetical protein